MKLTINGQARDFADLAPASSLSDLIAALDLKGDRIAVEHNGVIAARPTWDSLAVQEGDKLEIVHFVGGGR